MNIPLKYNVSNVLHDEQDSEFVMDLTEPAVWQQEYNVQKPGKEAESGNAMEVLAFRLSCSRRSEDDRLPKNEFMLQIDNIIAESEEAPSFFQLVKYLITALNRTTPHTFFL